MDHVSNTPSPVPETDKAADQHTPNKEVTVSNFQTVRKFGPWQMAFAAVVIGSLGIYALLQSFAAPPNKTPSPTSQPLSFTQSWSPRYPDQGLSKGCFGTDDAANWQGSGTLAAGASYTFTPSYPTCALSEVPMIAMHVGWSGSTQVKLEGAYPFVAALINNPGTIGQQLVAPVAADNNGNQQTNLCLWGDAHETAYMKGLDLTTTTFPWTMKITNTGTQTATISASGYEANGWAMNIYPGCKRADGDNDHWNDTLEMIMQDITYSASGAADRATAFQGSNYVAASGTATPDDEIDFSPADFNDDGVIDQTDVNTVTAYVGQGDGVSIDQIGPNRGTPGYIYDETLPWRRYDIDGDGLVTQHDVDWVKALVGQPLPLTSDPLSPWAVIHAPATVPANYAGYRVNVYAVDNDMLTHVDVYSTNGSKKQLLCQSWGENAVSGIPNTSWDQFGCNLSTPRSSGTTLTLTAIAYDNAGHSYTTTKTVTTQ